MSWLIVAMLVTAAIYWQGLVGPFLMDDGPGLEPVRLWMDGKATFGEAVLNNTGWHTHRALAYATLAANGAIGGFTAYSFKAGNLFFHLACGALTFLLMRKLLRRDSQLAASAGALACLVTSVWLLHPINVSTVLYPIQRMAQIALLISLVGLLFYAVVRERMIDGRLARGQGIVFLWIGIPLLTFLAVQGKQSAIVLPVSCLIVELAWFQTPKSWPRGLRTFYTAVVALPVALAVLVPFVFKERLGIAFSEYDFNAWEKMLTAPRVLWDYVRMLMVPHSPSMGIFGDGFAPSRSLMAPVSTLVSWLAMIAVLGLLWRLRRVAPAALAGWLLFLIGHAVEAGYTPIELYYEHRNYGVGAWLFLCVISLTALALSRLRTLGVRTTRISTVLAGGVLLALGAQTLGRSLIWQDAYGITSAAVSGNPESLRAVAAFAKASADLERFEDGFEAYERLGMSGDPIKQTQAALGKISLQCRAYRNADPADLQAALSRQKDSIDLGTFYMFHIIDLQRARYGCGPLTAEVLADALRDVADEATAQPDTTELKSSIRYLTSVFYMNADLPEKAAEQALLAWQPGVDPEVGRQLVDSLVGAGRPQEAQIYLLQVAERTHVDLRAPMKPSRDVWGFWDLQRKISESSGPQGPSNPVN